MFSAAHNLCGRFFLMGRKKPDPQLPDTANNRLHKLREARRESEVRENWNNQRAFREKKDRNRVARLNRPQSIARRKRLAEEREKGKTGELPPPRKNAAPKDVVKPNVLPAPRPSRNGKKSWDLPRPGQYLVPDIPHGIYPRKPLPAPKPSDKPKPGTYVPPPPDDKKQNKIQLWWLQ